MEKTKFVTYNFYQKDGKFFLISCGKHVEVSKDVFEVYKSESYKEDYSNYKFNSHTSMFFYNLNDIEKEVYEKKAFDVVEDYVSKETDLEFLSQFTPRVRQIIELWLEGYNDTEISKLIGVTRQGIYNIKSKLRQKLS